MANGHDGSLTPRQQEIVSLDVPRLAIVAAAGSGKTRVLVARYLRHVIEEGRSPGQILTITYTVKAAAEMRGRIVNSLLEAGKDQAAREAETGPIQTIDAWVGDFLRSNALAAGLDPEFEVLDGARHLQFLAYSFREALAETQVQDVEVQRLVGILAGERDGRDLEPYSLLQNHVREWVSSMRASLYAREDLERMNASPEGLFARFQELALREAPEAVLRNFEEMEGPFHERLSKAYEAAKADGIRKPRWLGPTTDEDEERNLALSAALGRLSLSTWERLDQRMWAEQKFDFTAQTRMAVKLLEDSPEVRDRLRATYPIVMVDEAQDVSPAQHRLLEAIGCERLVWIGDPQQSIYGFRDADVELFLETVKRSEEVNMTQNMRSKTGVQAFIDQSVGNWWSSEAKYKPLLQGEVDLDQEQRPYWPEAEIWDFQERDTPALARMIAKLKPARWKDVAVLVFVNSTGEQLEEELRKLKVPCKMVGGRRALLTRLEVRDLANVLRAVADPSDDYSLLCVLRSPLVQLSLDSLSVLAGQSPISEHLEAFEPLLEEDRRRLEAFLSWFRPLSLLGDRLSAAEVISDLFGTPGLLEALSTGPQGARALANVRQILQMAISQPELGPLEFAGQIQEIQSLQHMMDEPSINELDQDELSILTIHKSKGLEFPIVVVAETYQKADRDRTKTLAMHRTGGLAILSSKADSPVAARWLSQTIKKKTLEETQRMMYVAMTRAKERLVVVGTSKRMSSPWIASEIVRGFGRSVEDWSRYAIVRTPGDPEPPESEGQE